MANCLHLCALLCIFHGAFSESLVWVGDRPRNPFFTFALVRRENSRERGYTWHEARDICRQNRAELLYFDREDNVMPIIDNVTADYFWTEGNRLEDVNRWKFHRENIGLWHISSEYRNKRCAAVLLEKPSEDDWWRKLKVKSWKTMNCGNDLSGFICKRRGKLGTGVLRPDTAIAKTNCPAGWIDAKTNRCYMGFEHPTGLSWETAEQTCLALPYYKPNLACANTRDEMYTLTRLSLDHPPSARFWFGLFRERSDGPWMWADNSRINATNFHRYFDQSYDYGGGVIDNSAIPEGSWDLASGRDGLMSRAKMVLCQVEKDPDYNHTSPALRTLA